MSQPRRPQQEGQDQMFGPPPLDAHSVYWAQPDPNRPPGQPTGGSTTQLNENAKLTLADDAESLIMQEPGVAAALLEHGQRVATAATERATIPGARYEAVLIKDGGGHPQVIVQTANREAEIDEAAHSTLTVAMTTAIAQAGSGE